jgi:hypothetical protein
MKSLGTKIRSFGLLLALSTACGPGKSDVLETQVRPFEGEQGMQPGVGSETVFEDIRGSCVEFDGVEVGGQGQQAVFDLGLINNHKELSTELNISSASQIKAAIPDSGVNASVKANFMLGHSYNLNRYSVFLLAKAQIRNETTQLLNVRIRQDIREALASNDSDAIDRFRIQCGDAFLSGFTTGGEFFGVIEIQAETEAQQLQVKRDLEVDIAADGFGEISTQQSFEAKIKSVTKNRNIRIWTYQRGGNGSEQVGLVDTVERMLERLRAFPGYVTSQTNAANYTATFKDYFTLDLPLPSEYRNELFNAQDIVSELGGIHSSLIDLKGDIQYIISHPNSFVGVNDTKISELKNELKGIQHQMKEIYRTARNCARNYRDCRRPEALGSFASKSLPQRKLTAQQLARDVVHIRTKLEHINLNSIRDNYFNSPECYVDILAKSSNGKFKRIRRTVTTYDQARCQNLSQEFDIPVAMLEGVFRSFGIEPSQGLIEIRVMEDDGNADSDDIVESITKSYQDITREHALIDTMSGKSLTMEIELEVR